MHPNLFGFEMKIEHEKIFNTARVSGVGTHTRTHTSLMGGQSTGNVSVSSSRQLQDIIIIQVGFDLGSVYFLKAETKETQVF